VIVEDLVNRGILYYLDFKSQRFSDRQIAAKVRQHFQHSVQNWIEKAPLTRSWMSMGCSYQYLVSFWSMIKRDIVGTFVGELLLGKEAPKLVGTEIAMDAA